MAQGGNDEKYRDLYLEEKFRGMNMRINTMEKNMDEKLDKILEQTSKTNGRVDKLEDVQLTCPIKAVKELGEIVKKETEVVRFFGRYPAISKVTAVGLLALLVLNAVLYLKTIF